MTHHFLITFFVLNLWTSHGNKKGSNQFIRELGKQIVIEADLVKSNSSICAAVNAAVTFNQICIDNQFIVTN